MMNRKKMKEKPEKAEKADKLHDKTIDKDVKDMANSKDILTHKDSMT